MMSFERKKEVSIGNALIIPTGTINYLASVYNTKTQERELLFDGGLALHCFIKNLYDLFYNYLNNVSNCSSENKITYIHAILKPETDCRPECPIILKLEGYKNKNERLKRFNNVKEETLKIFEEIFSCWGGKRLLEQGFKVKEYRNDGHSNDLRHAYQEFELIKDKIMKLS